MQAKTKLVAAIGAGAVAMAVPLVQKYEGTVLGTYLDPVGIVTACTGHTSQGLRLHVRYTPEHCEQLLYGDLLKHAKALDCVKAPMRDEQKAAFLSFAFNVGNRAFCGSTLVEKANASDMQGACAELSRWVYAGERKLQGLVNRRAAERALCEGGLKA